ncbi:MAG: insulinase family protein [Myxococcales bacterium]|nr:insulinase family protein [Myxococcales bacterium]
MSRRRRLAAVLVLLLAAACKPKGPEVVPQPVPTPTQPVPAPADPPPVTEGDVTEARVNGMTVLVKRMPNAELVAVKLFVRGGARDWGAADAGVEALALRVATSGGTAALDKEAFGRRLAALGGAIDADTGRDFSQLAAKGPLASFDALFGLLADCFLRPAMPAAEVEIARQQQLLGLERAEEQPDSRLAILLNATLYKGHPYENRPEGTKESVARLTPAQLVEHLAALRQTSRLVLVVAGALEPGHVVELARASFGAVPVGKYEPAPLPRPSYQVSTLTTEARDLPTNYIQAMFPAPGPGAPDFAAARVATTALHERLFTEVRTKRNLSYAPGTRYEVSEAASLGGIYVTAVDPNATLRVMYDELRKLRDTPLPEVELAGTKAQYRTHYLMGRETTDGQADSLAMGLLRTGDWRFDGRLLAQVQAVSAADVQAYARTYIDKLQVVLLGDPGKLDPKLATGL